MAYIVSLILSHGTFIVSQKAKLLTKHNSLKSKKLEIFSFILYLLNLTDDVCIRFSKPESSLTTICIQILTA